MNPKEPRDARPAARSLVRLARPQQWYKNLVVLVALVFSNNLFSTPLWPSAGIALVAFCLLSSAVYSWNDVFDLARDREHPKKQRRPVASGAVSPTEALAWGGLLSLFGLLLLAIVNAPTLLLGVAFLLLQILYNILLKDQVIWDVLLIGIGFVVRALAGATAIEIGRPTVWLILCTFLFALFLGFAKRRHELVALHADPNQESAHIHRPTLREYNVDFVEQVTNMVAVLTLASYFLYTALGTTPWMMFTIPFAMYGVLRYLFLTKRRDFGDEPQLIFRDTPTMLNASAWILTVVLVLDGTPQRFFEWLQGL